MTSLSPTTSGTHTLKGHGEGLVSRMFRLWLEHYERVLTFKHMPF
ncbi:hypothetical protein [Methylobacterium sp. A54F]